MKSFWMLCMIFGGISSSQGLNLTLPTELVLGSGGASYQIEGAWNETGKGVNVWDKYIHDHPTYATNNATGDVAVDFYHRYKEDIALFNETGLGFYRFSISWSRVLPNGYLNNISDVGLQFYKNLTAELVSYGIEPIVTLFHWDHPQYLEEMGGWTNELMVERFVEFANLMFTELGDSVKIWTTFNEPTLFCTRAYDTDRRQLAPNKQLTGIGKYVCLQNVLKAHALVYHLYNETYRDTQDGEIGIVNACTGYLPYNSSYTEAVDTAFEFECGWVFHPIYIGDYPEIMKTRIANRSLAAGYNASRLPELSTEWISIINGTSDYLGLNHYTSSLVRTDPADATDSGVLTSSNSSWTKSPTSSWLSVVPTGMRVILNKLKTEYGNQPVRIMENGYPDAGAINDYSRISYHYYYLEALLYAVKEDNCTVKSYGTWSSIDCLAWDNGYTPRFGIFSVNFTDPDLPRTARLSASWWKNVTETRELQAIPTATS